MRDRGNKTDDWAPSRLKSIEEVPVALGFLVVANGDFEQSIFGAANYGRDNDSIAGMAGAIAGALHGDRVDPPRVDRPGQRRKQGRPRSSGPRSDGACENTPAGAAGGGTIAAEGVRGA